ncbi:MAG: carboxymuconolactone decarboxylase family protein [Pseudomonadales bacterium]|jgi:4-carboxymuconolactone decarboxylase|nr:carboxymuconolactone decarboxylase family protein [Pseudomonadales bacterium]MDG1443170.1 carboxymuconolactone decarboxylase family protein [Pseudomonadales bacterium]
MRLHKPRIAPLHEDNWSEEQNDVLSGQKMRGNVQNIFRTMANHEKLAKRWLVFGNHILSKSTLPARDREIAILRIGWLCQAEYEWGQHVVIGKHAGINDEEIEAIKVGADAAWSEHDALVIRAADELHGDAFITDDTWTGLKKTYSDQQMMDLVFTCGQYNMVSMALNSFGVQLDPDISGF